MIKMRTQTENQTGAQSHVKNSTTLAMRLKPLLRGMPLFFAISFLTLPSYNAQAEAPVFDESDNFTIVEESFASNAPANNHKYSFDEPPAPMEHISIDGDDERPLVVDNEKPSNHKNLTTDNKVQALQKEIQELRGQLEVQAHELQLLKQQQMAFYKDLDARIRTSPNNAPVAKNAEIIPPVATPPPPTKALPQAVVPAKKVQQVVVPPTMHSTRTSTNRSNPADEQIRYLAAYELVKMKQTDQALTAMQTFVKQYPASGYTANAQYWVGELYLQKKNYPQALSAFNTVLQQFPTSNKASASRLKMGYVLAASGQKEKAVEQLQQVLKDYPDTAAAELATAKLYTLKIA